jgi:hypothetical protein
MTPYKDEPTTLLNKNQAIPKDIETAVEETAPLLTGYGAVAQKDGVLTPFNASEDFPLDNEETTSPKSRQKSALKRWGWIGAGAILYVAGVMAWNSARSNNSMSLGTKEAVDVELLGSSKKTSKKTKKTKKPKFEPIPYPSCPSGVEMSYIKEALPFEMHEMAAEASNCHLASIHTMEELEKYSKAGLFKVSYGPEIGMSFAAGKPLTKTFWLGGRFGADMDVWEWTDNSTWDFGPNATTVEGCLASTFSFLEISMPIVAPEDHWSVVDCNTPLPAIYKCCIETSMNPSEVPTDAPTDPPTDAPTDPPTDAPTDPPTDAPTDPPTDAPTDPPTVPPTVPPTEEPAQVVVEEPKKKKHDVKEESSAPIDDEEHITPPDDEPKKKKHDAEEEEPAPANEIVPAPVVDDEPKKKKHDTAEEEAAPSDETATVPANVEEEEPTPADDEAPSSPADDEESKKKKKKKKKENKHDEEEAAPAEEAMPAPADEEAIPAPADEEAMPAPADEEAMPAPADEEAMPAPAEEGDDSKAPPAEVEDEIKEPAI